MGATNGAIEPLLHFLTTHSLIEPNNRVEERKKLFFDLWIYYLWYAQKGLVQYGEVLKKEIWRGARDRFFQILKKPDIAQDPIVAEILHFLDPEMVEFGFYVRDENERELCRQEAQRQGARLGAQTKTNRHTIAVFLFDKRCLEYDAASQSDDERFNDTGYIRRKPQVVYEHCFGKKALGAYELRYAEIVDKGASGFLYDFLAQTARWRFS